MSTRYDLTKISTEQLKRMLGFHENDNGTTTMEEECRRMWFCQEIPAELKRRSIEAKAA